MKGPNRLRLSKHKHLKYNSDPIEIEDAVYAIKTEKDLVILPECNSRLVSYLLENDSLSKKILYSAIREGGMLNLIQKMEKNVRG